MPIDKTKYDCSGCTACYNVCPENCISMEEDVLGFKYPKVDLTKCINCDLCVRKCPFNNQYIITDHFDSLISYAAKSKDVKEVNRSQSGAAFAILSDIIIKKGGVVYGVGYSGKFKATTKRATTLIERDEFRGSKYVQSDLGDSFKSVKDDLTKDKIVLFSGTPCQIAGLLAFIPQRLQKNLITIDLICHGVPAPKIWSDYISYLENKENSKIEKVNFRDKSLRGWRSHIESFKFVGKPYTYTYTYTYTYLFYNHINLRYSCGECPFTNLRRTGDITIGDCWGIENTKAAELGKDNKGCSLIIINSSKGEELFETAKPYLHFMPIDVYDVLQPQLREPSKLSPLRDKFEMDYIQRGFKYVKKKYGPPRRMYVKDYLKNHFPIIKAIKKFLTK